MTLIEIGRWSCLGLYLVLEDLTIVSCFSFPFLILFYFISFHFISFLGGGGFLDPCDGIEEIVRRIG